MRTSRTSVGAIFLALAIASPNQAQIKIDGELTVKEFAFAELTIKDKSSVIWRVYPTPVKKSTKGNTLYFSGKPGIEYIVTAMVIDFEAKSIEESEATVTFSGAGPIPPIEAAPKSIGLSLAFGPWSNGTVTGSTASVTGTAKITGGDPPGPRPPPDPKPPDPPAPGDPLVDAIRATNTPAAKLIEIATAFRSCADLTATGQTAARGEQLRAMALKSGIPGGVPDLLHPILSREMAAVNVVAPVSAPEHVITVAERDRIRAIYMKLAAALEAAK